MPNENVLSRKTLDIRPLQIDGTLKNSQLASFTRRATAFLVDWTIIILCTEMMWLILPLILLLWVIKGRLKSSLRKGQRLIKRNILLTDRRLASYNIDTRLRRRFARHMVVYLYILMYLPIVLAGGWIILEVIKLINPEQYGTFGARVDQAFATVFQPISSLNDAFELAIGFLGALLYFALFIWQWHGQTPGKKLLHIRVVKVTGQPFSFWSSLERATGYASSAAFLLFGFLQYFWERNRQTTHDKISSTVVVET